MNIASDIQEASSEHRSRHTAAHGHVPAHFCRKLVATLRQLKTRLQDKYEDALPGHRELVRQAVDEAEQLAWGTPFPHLFLPDFAEIRVAEIVAAREPAYARAA